MPTNFNQFSVSLGELAKRIPREHVRTAQVKISFEALRRLVMKTPVKEGRARGNWQVDIGKAPQGVIDEIRDAGATVSEGAARILNVPDYGTVWIANNVPYILRLENGWSQRAPNGMMGVTVHELSQIF